MLEGLPAPALVIVGRNGRPKISSSFPTPKNILQITPRDVLCLPPITSQLPSQENKKKKQPSSILSDSGAGITLPSYLSLFQPLCLYSSVYVLLVLGAHHARWHWPTKEDNLLWSIRFPEMKQPDFLPHLSSLGSSKTNG